MVVEVGTIVKGKNATHQTHKELNGIYLRTTNEFVDSKIPLGGFDFFVVKMNTI